MTAILSACGQSIEAQGLSLDNVIYFSKGGETSAPLHGSLLSGTVLIEVVSTLPIESVSFFLAAVSPEDPLKFDEAGPFDLVLDTTEVADGQHELRVTAVFSPDHRPTSAELSVVFAVSNSATEPPAPPEPPEPPGPPVDPSVSCLDASSGELVVITGVHTSGYRLRYLEPHTRIDASAASFLMPYPGTSHPLDPFTVRDAPYVCVSGGVYSPGIPDDEPDWELYHHSQGVYLRDAVSPVVERVTILESGDGVRFKENTQAWTFRDSYVQHAGDDAIENDQLYSGLVDDVLVDWAFVFLSCRLDTADRGAGYPPGGTVVVRDSLVALRPQVGAYSATNEGGRFFKWEKHDTPGCLLELRDNVFLVEAGEYASLYLDPSDDPDLDYESLIHSSGNIIVWLGDGDYPAPLPAGFTLTRDIGVWHAARDAWFDRHPEQESYR